LNEVEPQINLALERSEGTDAHRWYDVRQITHNYRTPPLTPPRLRGGEPKLRFGGVGFSRICQ